MGRRGRIGNVRITGLGTRLAPGAVALALVLAACSSDNAGPAPEPPVTDNSPSETVEAPKSTMTSTTSTSTTSTTPDPPLVIDTEPSELSEPAPETTAAEPLPAPTSTMFDPDTPSGEVEQVALADVAAFVVCLEQLPACDVDAAALHSAMAYADGTVELVSGWNEAGYSARDTDDYNYRVDGIAEFSEDGTEAIVLLCVWGATELYLRATETSPEKIIDGGFTSTKERVLVRRLGDDWFLTALDVDEETAGESNNLCV